HARLRRPLRVPPWIVHRAAHRRSPAERRHPDALTPRARAQRRRPRHCWTTASTSRAVTLDGSPPVIPVFTWTRRRLISATIPRTADSLSAFAIRSSASSSCLRTASAGGRNETFSRLSFSRTHHISSYG